MVPGHSPSHAGADCGKTCCAKLPFSLASLRTNGEGRTGFTKQGGKLMLQVNDSLLDIGSSS
jgi:hypothetical protein